MMTTAGAVRAALGIESLFASADPSDVRCLVEVPAADAGAPEDRASSAALADAGTVDEWLIRALPPSLTRRPAAPAPRCTPPSSPSTVETNGIGADDGDLDGRRWRRMGIERQLDEILRIDTLGDWREGRPRSTPPAIREPGPSRSPSSSSSPSTSSASVLEQLYTNIPRYSAADRPEEVLRRLHRSHATGRSSHLTRLRGIYTGSDGTTLGIFDYEDASLQDLCKYNRHLLDDDQVRAESERGHEAIGVELTETDVDDDPRSPQAPDPQLGDLKRRFIIYQLWRAMLFLHQRRLTCGELTPTTVLLSDASWVRLGVTSKLSSSFSPPQTVESMSSRSTTERWCDGDLSNYEYLMAINAAAGRRMVDAVFHPVLPWVVDFTSRHGGWRDLTKSKFRLNKGDHQLDRTYESSMIPHHITESLSEITYYIYMARRTPMQMLRQVVRANFQPREYPSTMERMYEWTPDECIPEFYSDPSVFSSIHGDSMEDMTLPAWCHSPEDFIKSHRAMLESPEVSRTLHTWIDLNFGVCLVGEEAVLHKNVPLPSHHGNDRTKKSPGFVQVFKTAHPRRKGFRADSDNANANNDGRRRPGHRRLISSMTHRSSEEKMRSEAMLNAAIKIADDAFNDIGLQVHGDITALRSTPISSIESKMQATTARIMKPKKKSKNRPKSHGFESSPVSPSSQQRDARSPSVGRFAHAIPRFFNADSNALQSGLGSSGQSTSVSTHLSPSGQTHGGIGGFPSLQPSASSSASGHGLSHSQSLPPSAAPSSSPHNNSSSHIFRDLWHQISRQDDDEGSEITETSGISEFDWTDADYEFLDETGVLLLQTCQQIEISTPNQFQLAKSFSVSPDTDFVQAVEEASAAIDPVYSLPHPNYSSAMIGAVPSLSEFDIRIAADAFALGCLITELYSSSPLFTRQSVEVYVQLFKTTSVTTTQSPSKLPEECEQLIHQHIRSIPLIAKDLVLRLIHPNPQERIHAYVTQSRSIVPGIRIPISDCAQENSLRELHTDFFPAGFGQIHKFLSDYHRTKSWSERYHAVQKHLDDLLGLPDDLIRIVLPVLTRFFKAESQSQSLCVHRVAMAVVDILPRLSRRLGSALFNLELRDDVLKIYESTHLTFILKLSLSVPEVLKVLVDAFGPVGFTRQLLPVLTEWLTTTADYSDSYVDENKNRQRRNPLFAVEALAMVGTGFGEMASSEGLGASLCVKYVLPLILPHIGKTQSRWLRLAEARQLVRRDSRAVSGLTPGNRTAFGGKHGDGIHVAFIEKSILYDVHPVADALLLICRELPENSICHTVLPHLVGVLPRLVDTSERISSVRIEGVPNDLAREIYIILRMIRHVVKSLSDQAVLREFVQMRSAWLIDLLNKTHPPFLHPRTLEAVSNAVGGTNVDVTQPSTRNTKPIAERLRALQRSKTRELRAFTAVGLARTVVNIFHKIGPEAAGAASGIVQAVNAFLVRCAGIYSELEVSDFQWKMASEVVTEFCSPLRVLLGAEAFSKLFPSVQASSVLQLLLLPSTTTTADDGGTTKDTTSEASSSQPTIESELTRRELEAIRHCPPQLVQFAYRSSRLHNIKTTSFLHIPARIVRYTSEDMTEAVFVAHEEKKRRRSSMANPRQGGDHVWLRPLVSTAFALRGQQPAAASSDLGASWSTIGEVRHVTRAHSSAMRAMDVSPDEQIVISASKNGTSRAWRLAVHPCTSQAAFYSDGPVLSVQQLGHGELAMTVEERAVHIWNVQTSQVRCKFPFLDDSVTAVARLRALPYHHHADFVGTRCTSMANFRASMQQGHADFVVATCRRLFTMDLRQGPRIVADWRVDAQDAAWITATTVVVNASCRAGCIAAGTATGHVVLLDRHMGRRRHQWPAMDSRILKLEQYAPTFLLVVGGDREARVWQIQDVDHPRLRMVVTGLPDGLREPMISVQCYADTTVLYVAAGSKIYTARLLHEPTSIPTSPGPDVVVTTRVESMSLLDNTQGSLLSTMGATVTGSGGPISPPSSSALSPQHPQQPHAERSRLHKSKHVAQSLGVLPLWQIVLLGTEDGSMRACV